MDQLIACLKDEHDPVEIHITAAEYLSAQTAVEYLQDGDKIGEYSILRNRHFLKDLFVLLKTLDSSTSFSQLSVIHNIPWIRQILGSFMVLYCWEDIAAGAVNSALLALSELLTFESASSTPILDIIGNAVQTIRSQFGVIASLLSSGHIDDNDYSDVEFCELFDQSFQSLQETSVLPAILNFRDLGNVTTDFIQNLPVVKYNSEQEFSSKKVRFRDEEEECVLLLPADRAKDISVFRGYCVILDVMVVIYQDASSRKMSMSSKRSSRLSLLRESSMTDDFIGSDLSNTEKNLREILPLNFRLEVMEDVFSLLFLRSGDLKESHAPEQMFNGDESDTGSVRSLNSVGKSVHDGFACSNEILLRKILLLLREVSIFSSSQSKAETDSSVQYPCSITPAEFSSRLSSFQQIVTDALWRLDVVTFPKDIPLSLNAAYVDDLVRPSFLTRKLDSKKSKRRRQKKRKTSTIIKKHVDSSVVEKILASPDSLLRICLHRGTFDLADQVIRIFSLDDQDWSRELDFGENYSKYVKKIYSKEKVVSRKKFFGSVSADDIPLKPFANLTEDQVDVLVEIDSAFLTSAADFRNCGEVVKSTVDSMSALSTKFPTLTFVKLPGTLQFEEFIRSHLEDSVSLSRRLPFRKAMPFSPISHQSLLALQDEISRRVNRIHQIFVEGSKNANSGMGVLKSLNKIMSDNITSGGLLVLINGVVTDPRLTVQRMNFLLATILFFKNYATALKFDPEKDNFGFMYQSPYQHIIRILKTMPSEIDVDVFIRTMALDIPRLLFRGIPAIPSYNPLLLSDGPINLNSNNPNLSFCFTSSAIHLASNTLARILKIFRETRDNIYNPQFVTWSLVADSFSDLAALQEVELSSLRSDAEKLSFFINTYNLLFIHANIHARMHSVHESVGNWEENEVATRLHFWRYRYQIWSLGAVSLQNLYDGLSPLRSPLSGNNIEPPRRKENGFLLANSGYKLPIRVIHPDLLKMQNSLAIDEYFNGSVMHDEKKNIIRLPTWLFQVYPSDQLYEMVRTHWRNPASLSIEPDKVVLEPSRKLVPKEDFRRDTTITDCRASTPLNCTPPKSAEAEDVDRFNHLPLTFSFEDEAPEIPLEELLPSAASPCSYLIPLLSPGGGDNRLLPMHMTAKMTLSLLSGMHNRVIPLHLLCRIFSSSMKRGESPLSLLKVPAIYHTLNSSPVGNMLHDMVIATGIEKGLINEAWTSVGRIQDYDLRLRCVQLMWRKWPISSCVELFDILEVEDSRSVIKGIHSRIRSLQQLIHSLNSDVKSWTEIFPQLKFQTVAKELAVRDVEKRLESQFTNFIAIMLRLNQIEPLNAWLQQSEMSSLAVYEEELQLRGLVHMLDSKPPMILSAYQLLIPMLQTCQFDRVIHLLEAISSPEGRLPVIRIALICGRFDEVDRARLKEKQVENLIIQTLPDFFRKTIAHLQNHTLLVLEQLIVWNRLDYLREILKIPSLFEVFSRRLFDGLLVDYARKAVEVSTLKSSRSGSIMIDERRPRRNTSGSEVSTASSFILPSTVPGRNEWTNDATVTNCVICGDKFSIFNRKHHCRRCGRVVCGSCSSQTIQIDAYGDNPVRACEDCFDQTIAMGSSSHSSKSSAITFSASKLRSPPVSSPIRTAPDSRLLRQTLSVPDGNEQQKWLFTTDDTSNQRLRNEFFFATSPDAVMCVGLLRLHSNTLVAGKELLKLGNELSEWIGEHNDCGLENTTVLGTMRTLFLQAKVFLLGDPDTGDWINVCDNYLNHLQLIEMLLDAGATEIPSVQQLAQLDTIRRVRDQLVQQERYALAIDISTKAGLDPANVWLSWGRCLLKVGKFIEAEDKLSKCLKAPVDKNQFVSPSGSALEDLMDVILDARMPRRRGTMGADSIIEVVLHGDILKPEAVDPSLIETENFRKMTEALRYQEMFGTHLSLMKFYMGRGLVQKALEYALRENVSVETFMEAVVNPSVRAGNLRSLEDELLMSDPTLAKWADYLTGICKLLTKRNLNHLLLSFQLFMKDYLRAATTCVMFFQTGGQTNSYQSYFDRLHYLEEAQKHILTYLQASGQTHDLSEKSTKLRLTLPEEEVRKYLRTIQLQVLMTQLLSSRTRLEEQLNLSLPTIFGNSQAKTDLIVLLLEQHNSAKAEDYVISLMELHGLPVEDVFVGIGVSAKREVLKGMAGVLERMKKQGMLSEQQYDLIILKIVGQISPTSMGAAAKEWENIIKQMSSDEKKVEAFVKAGKLKSAYLLAVGLKRSDLIEYIAGEAGRVNDASVLNISKRWLEQNRRT